MLIGNRYSDDKLYRGLRHYDSLPLTSGDLHEYSDILMKKNAFLLNNLLGSGVLNEPELSISSTGVSLKTPSVLLIDGDISLVQSDSEILRVSSITESGISDGVLCIVGWYQSLTANSTLRSYGGVNNSEIPNDIMDTNLNVQVSTRYQLRWDTVLVARDVFENPSNFNFTLPNRDAGGYTTSGSLSLRTSSKLGDVRVATRPVSMDYALSDLYIVPILMYKYTSGNFSELRTISPLKPEGALGALIKDPVEPTGYIEEGTIWYDTARSKFKFYVDGVGFVPTASDLTLLQYRNTVTLTTTRTTPADIQVSIGLDTYKKDDILQVLYEGVVLTENIHYTVSSDAKSITLLSFKSKAGDQITFVATKLVDATSITSVDTVLSSHINLTGGVSSKGHVSLSDTPSVQLDRSSGVAATPKSVYDATTLRDSVTGKYYRLTVSNGVLGIVEV